VFALEVPTGWVADRLGHRVSLIIGSFVQVCAMLVFWQAATPPALLAASLLVALGDAFRSGADEALLYRSCVGAGPRRRVPGH
jgi:fucose permease